MRRLLAAYFLPVAIAALFSLVLVAACGPGDDVPRSGAHTTLVYVETLAKGGELDVYRLDNGGCLWVVWGKLDAPSVAVTMSGGCTG